MKHDAMRLSMLTPWGGGGGGVQAMGGDLIKK